MRVSNFVITQDGQNLMAKILSGATNVSFTAMKTSKDYVEFYDLETLTNLTNIMQTSDINDIKIKNNSEVEISALFNNTNLENGYNCNTIGLFATDPDNGEILYAAMSAMGGTGDYIPSSSEKSNFSISIKDTIAVGNSENISLSVDPAGAATVSQINDLQQQLDVLKNIEIQLANGETTTLYALIASVASKDYVDEVLRAVSGGMLPVDGVWYANNSGDLPTATADYLGRNVLDRPTKAVYTCENTGTADDPVYAWVDTGFTINGNKITLDETKSYNIPITLAIWNYTGATGNGEAVMSYNEGWAITINAYQFNIADGSITEAKLSDGVKQKLHNAELSQMIYDVRLQLLPGGTYGQGGDTTKNYPYVTAKITTVFSEYVGYSVWLFLYAPNFSATSTRFILPDVGDVVEVGILLPSDQDSYRLMFGIFDNITTLGVAFYYFDMPTNVIATTKEEYDKIPSEYFADTAPSLAYFVQN